MKVPPLRALILLSTLVLSVVFRLWPDYGQGMVGFAFSQKELNTQSWIYYTMEHVNSLAIAACFLISDNTPRFLFVVFAYIMLADLIHYWLFFRDEGIGFNLFKVVIFTIALLWTQLKR